MEKSALANELSGRTERFQALLKTRDLDGAIVLQKVALYYFTGTDQDAHLWIPSSGPPLLMVRKSVDRARTDAAVPDIIPLSGFGELPGLITEHTGHAPQRIGLEMDILPVNYFRAYEKLFPGMHFEDISPMLRQVRSVKSAHELSLIRKAADLGDRLCREVPRFLAEVETETDLAIRAETFYRSEGHPGLVRIRTFNMETIYGHIMAGPGSTTPSSTPGPTGGMGPGPFASQGASNMPIDRGVPVLVDFAANIDGYLADQARIYSKGKLPEKFYRAHQVMIDVQEAVAEKGTPGVIAGDLFELARKIVEKAGLTEGFMGHPQSVPFVGHGVGLELDEWPLIGRHAEHVLEQGMVVALEPKFVFPGEGIAGVENTFVITAHGMEKLNSYPEEIVEVPA